MRFIDGNTVENLLDMKSCIRLMRETLIDLAEGRAEQMLRLVMPLHGGNLLGVMPGAIAGKKVAGAKIISVFPDNFYQGLPSHQGVVLVFETQTGKLQAVLDGESITGIRTAAVSAAATELLARKDAETLALIGCGLQARKHLEALIVVRDIKQVFVWDIDAASASRYAIEMSKKIALPVQVCKTSQEALKEADIICTVTAAQEPVICGAHIKNGAHINAVGACRPTTRELDTQAVLRGRIYADSMESLLSEAGDFLIPFAEGAVTKEQIAGELGEAFCGKIDGRRDASEITIFESLGLAVYDIAAAEFVINKLAESGGSS